MDTSCLEVGCPRCRPSCRPGGGPSLVGLLLLLLGLLTRPSLRRPGTHEKFQLLLIEEEYVAYNIALQKIVDGLKWELIGLDASMKLTKVGLRFWRFANKCGFKCYH